MRLKEAWGELLSQGAQMPVAFMILTGLILMGIWKVLELLFNFLHLFRLS